MKSAQELRALLQSIDHKSYPAYKSTQGCYRFPDYLLSIDHVQGDPFASPSRVSIHIDGKTAGKPICMRSTREPSAGFSEQAERSRISCPQRLTESRPLFPLPFALKLYFSISV